MFFLTKTPYLLKKFYPKQLIWNKSRAEKVIYLTFDDGPIPIVTPWVIKTLKNFNAKATFFCIGDNITKHPEIFEQLKADGHTIGNHTFNHLKGWKTDDETYLANFLKCQELTQTNLFRPPYGRIKKSQIEKILNNGYQVASIEYQDDLKGQESSIKYQDDLQIQESSIKYQDDLQSPYTLNPKPQTSIKPHISIIMWDVLSGDFDPSLKPEKCLRNVLNYTENGSVVVFHDSLKAWDRLEFVLPKVLEVWRDEGFEFGVL
ncbi:polysaccharide deacetylase family protein [Pedobacter arcticus]|uniref:polysaccharide deacetylase family protein n=1 Tax=Pedobacter arcticus TaxID=752140 RepID=UPI0002EBE226|nr:polysaccharide deacetylase family protein [Pedobacter arcticus]